MRNAGARIWQLKCWCTNRFIATHEHPVFPVPSSMMLVWLPQDTSNWSHRQHGAVPNPLRSRSELSLLCLESPLRPDRQCCRCCPSSRGSQLPLLCEDPDLNAHFHGFCASTSPGVHSNQAVQQLGASALEALALGVCGSRRERAAGAFCRHTGFQHKAATTFAMRIPRKPKLPSRARPDRKN